MRHFRFALLLALSFTAVLSCGDTLGLPRAIDPNVVDTVSLFALTGTPPTSPSAYELEDARPVRTDQATENALFDFAFDIDTAGRAVFIPAGVLRMPPGSGLQSTTVDFDSILIAPNRDYQPDSALEVQVGTVALVQSRLTQCTFGIQASFYAKLQVLDIDTTSAPGGRFITFQILVNQNCGYRGLEPGLPSR